MEIRYGAQRQTIMIKTENGETVRGLGVSNVYNQMVYLQTKHNRLIYILCPYHFLENDPVLKH